MNREFDEIYRLYVGDVYRFLLRLSGDAGLAEELTQETMFRAFRSINKFDGGCKLSVWLCQIGKNCFYDRCRKDSRLDLSAEIPETQNHFTAISEGSYQVNAEVSECGELALCRHTIRAGEAKEIVAPLDSKLVEQKGSFGEIYKEGEKYYMRFEKILLENGKELDSIHSGNTNAIALPLPLPPFSFLRENIGRIL